VAESKPASVSPEAGYAEKRRTQRVQITMPVVVRGTSGSESFEDQAFTISINANGCMILLARPVTRAQKLSLVNPKTAEELACSVVYLGKKMDGKTELGLEFAEPSPLFWRIAFPPEDWDPAERKRPTAQPPRPLASSTPKR